jgi:hypothetical protein
MHTGALLAAAMGLRRKGFGRIDVLRLGFFVATSVR